MRENKERSSDSRFAAATTKLPIDSIASHDAGDRHAELAFKYRVRVLGRFRVKTDDDSDQLACWG